MPKVRLRVRRQAALDGLPRMRARPLENVTAGHGKLPNFAAKSKTKAMTLIFAILAALRVFQIAMFAAYAAGHRWCLAAFLAVTGLMLATDLTMLATILATHRDIDKNGA